MLNFYFSLKSIDAIFNSLPLIISSKLKLQHGDLYPFSFFGKYNLLHLEHFPSKGIVSIVISEESNHEPKTAALKVLINYIGSTQVNSPILRLIFSTTIFFLFFFSAHSSMERIRHFVISTSCTKIYLHF